MDLQISKRQKAFLDADATEVLFGGAAGGGKSYGQLIDALLYALKYPKSKQLILRRTFPDLERSLVLVHLSFYPRPPVYRYNSSNHRGTFQNGSTIEFGYCDKEKDVYQYQGAEYDTIRFDELTHFTEHQYTYLMSRLRGANNYPKQIKSSTNPGGVGHAWVKARFLEGALPDVKREVKNGTRVFLPSKVQDNQFLLKADKDYVRRLENLPEKERKALLEGDWDIFEGQVFEEWRNDPTHYEDGLWTHVINPFELPKHWKIWRGYDFGYSKPYSVGWYAATPDGKIYRVKELYGWNGTPNEGSMETPQQQAERIREIENTDPILKGRTITGVADPAIFDESRGMSIARMMEQSPNFIYWHPGDNTRLAGKMQYHYRFAFDKNGQCMFQVFNTCRQFIRTIPELIYDAKKPEDIDTSMEDHIYDECRYVLMDNPISPRERVKPPIIEKDPLDLHKQEKPAMSRFVFRI